MQSYGRFVSIECGVSLNALHSLYCLTDIYLQQRLKLSSFTLLSLSSCLYLFLTSSNQSSHGAFIPCSWLVSYSSNPIILDLPPIECAISCVLLIKMINTRCGYARHCGHPGAFLHYLSPHRTLREYFPATENNRQTLVYPEPYGGKKTSAHNSSQFFSPFYIVRRCSRKNHHTRRTY